MKRYISVSIFLFLVVDNSYSMTTSLRQVGQRNTQTFGKRSYGLWQSRAAEQAVQRAKAERANQWWEEENAELDEYFKKKPWYRPNQDVFQKRPTFSDSFPQAVSLQEKTDLSLYDRLKNAFYSLFTTSSSRTAEQAIQEDNTRRFNDWWEKENK